MTTKKVKKVTVEITAEKGIVRLFSADGEEINRSETVHSSPGGTTTSFDKGDFETMDDEVLSEELWFAIEQNFFVYHVLKALHIDAQEGAE
ncbi:hypothetical protein QRX25_10525 [Bacillus sp. L381]|uniref:hypothetical protein n=1 Tax=Bacillus TaxID=1386 RepID=UPI001BAD4247|nr:MULTISPECIES: hypothetical protein [Bacillus]MCR9040927.1 hypothetical protein [Bacillus velezensis]QUN07988.1 hypothetical protein KEF49_10380 [Bacillus amyloliquefaciens]QYM81054.1 hypothetical protein KTJ85_10230 [Bacillus sp. 7D3]QZY10202.1 hypothetical protein K7B13_10460 [Bacillus amyloliquefaciens]QZY11112.1 hypothetical protein K7B13_15460 [Bacillus amyloliquefaciens]